MTPVPPARGRHPEPWSAAGWLQMLSLRSSCRTALPGLALWVALGWLAWPDVPSAWTCVWATCGALVVLTRAALVHRLTRKPESEWPLEALSRTTLACAIMLGALAAVGGLVVFPRLSAERQAVMTMVCVAWIAGGFGTSGLHAPDFRASPVPLVAALAAGWLSLPGRLGLAMGGLLIVYWAVLASAQRGHRRQLLGAIEQQQQLSRRCEELERALALQASLLSTTGHELRQPVASLGLLNHALQHSESGDASRSIARRMNAPIESLHELLDVLARDSRHVPREQDAAGVLRPTDDGVRTPTTCGPEPTRA